jgi:hypothetical protein
MEFNWRTRCAAGPVLAAVEDGDLSALDTFGRTDCGGGAHAGVTAAPLYNLCSAWAGDDRARQNETGVWPTLSMRCANTWCLVPV